MKLTSLNDLFLHELKDLYDAEHQLVEALPRMARAATDPDLKAAFEKHLAETRKHVIRLKGVFEKIGEEATREPCRGIKSLLEEGNKVTAEAADPVVLDAALVAAAQKVEHYEIAAYGTLITWVTLAGLDSSLRLLEQTLEEERAADEKLTEIAESSVSAADELGEGMDADEEGELSTSRSAGRNARTTPDRSNAPARSRRTTK